MMASIDQRADLVAFFLLKSPIPPFLSASVFHCKSNGINKGKREKGHNSKDKRIEPIELLEEWHVMIGVEDLVDQFDHVLSQDQFS
jgi:hypothetical protein